MQEAACSEDEPKLGEGTASRNRPLLVRPDFDIPMGNVGYGSEAVVTIFALHVGYGS